MHYIYYKGPRQAGSVYQPTGGPLGVQYSNTKLSFIPGFSYRALVTHKVYFHTEP